MVASASGDLYSPFHPTMISEDGPQSSEEGSGLHSPVFGPSYTSPHGDSFRYQHDQLDVQPSANVLAPQYDHYTIAQQQGPIPVASIDLPSSPAVRPNPYSTQYLPHSSHPSHPPRNQLGLDFHSDSRINHAAQPTNGPVEWYPISPRRPGGTSPENAYPRQPPPTTLPIGSDPRQQLIVPPERPTESSNAASATPAPREERKATSSVVIACRQCRSRKIRCDSTRPVCNNCVRRNNPCEYDAVPKRRGPDKRPGTRQRSCKRRPTDGSAPPPPKRKKVSDRMQEARDSIQSRIKSENVTETTRPTALPRSSERSSEAYQFQAHQVVSPTTDLRIETGASALLVHHENSPIYRSRPMYYEQQESQSLSRTLLQKPPSIEADNKAMWDHLLKSHSLPGITQEIRFLAEGTGHMLSFINLEYLQKRLWSEEQRQLIHPAFIYAALALSRLMKSSRLGQREQGLRLALSLKNEASRSLQASLSAGWIELSLAETAFILAVFESSAHPEYSQENAAAALLQLDHIICYLHLQSNDQHEPNVSHFFKGVPVVYTMNDGEVERNCTCIAILPSQTDVYGGNKQYIPPWDASWTAEQIRAEETRRLCWSALDLISTFLAQCAADNRPTPQFGLSDTSKYMLLFPGEVSETLQPLYASTASLGPKESVWALYCRSMLLWNYCLRFREDTEDEEARADEVHEAWSEVQAIEDALDCHECNIDASLIYTAREYIYNTRMLVTQALRSFRGYDRGPPTPQTTPGPIIKRKQVEEWVVYQNEVVRRVIAAINRLDSPDAIQLTERPFRVQWFIYQLSICIRLWDHERNLEEALTLGKRLLHVVDVMNDLWDCPANRQAAAELRHRLTDACGIMRVEPPPFTQSYIPIGIHS